MIKKFIVLAVMVLGSILNAQFVNTNFNNLMLAGGQNRINVITEAEDGKYLVGGSFTHIGGHSRWSIAKITTNGTVDTSFINVGVSNPIYGAVGTISAIAKDTSTYSPPYDRGYVIGGIFQHLDGNAFGSVGWITSNGTVRASMNDPKLVQGGMTIGHVNDIIVDSYDPSYIIGGWFSRSSSPSTTYTNYGIEVLKHDGWPDTSFTRTSLASTIGQGWGRSITRGLGFPLTDPIWNFVIGGEFDAIGTHSTRFVGLMSNGGNPGTSFTSTLGPARPDYGFVFSLYTTTNKYMVCGEFRPDIGTPGNFKGIYRLNTNGTIDTTYNTPYNIVWPRCLELASDGKYLVGGGFTNISGLPYRGLARLNANGSLDTSFPRDMFNVGGTTPYVEVVKSVGAGNYLIGGMFTNVDGYGYNGLVMINGDISVSQNWYVSPTGTGNGTSWTQATNSLVGALSIAMSGDTVWADTGTYTGTFTIPGGVTLRSRYNNPTNTVLDAQGTGRAVTQGSGSQLIGFSVKLGAVNTSVGGGVRYGVISNCIVHANTARYGGGVADATIYNSTIWGNYGGAPFDGSAVGGGIYNCTAYNSLIQGNQSWGSVGNAYGSTLYNCTLYNGVSVLDTTVNESQACSFYNSIVWGTSRSVSHNEYSCGPGFAGTGSITDNPQFTSGGYGRLKISSPCINTGNNAGWVGLATSIDLDGNPRIYTNSPGTVDMGAYEFQGNPYQLTYTAGIGGSIAGDNPQWILTGSNGTEVTAIPYLGYAFTNWSDGVLTAGRTELNVQSNITVTANFVTITSVDHGGAGVYNSIVYDSVIVSNIIGLVDITGGGGALNSTLYRCIVVGNSSFYGGGTYGSEIYNSILYGNLAQSAISLGGGGAIFSVLYNSQIDKNSSLNDGGGTYASTLYNCTVISNSASGLGGGNADSIVYNTISYFNNKNDSGVSDHYSCGIGYVGTGSIVANPSIAVTNRIIYTDPIITLTIYKLAAGSPCIDKAYLYSWMRPPGVISRDLEDNLRLRFVKPDMGAVEGQYRPRPRYIIISP